MPDHVDRLLDAIDLDTDIEDVQLDRAQVKQLAAIKRLMYRQQEKIMATIEDLNALVAQTGADAQAAADRVIASLGDASAQIADLQAQVAALIAAAPDPTALQAVADGLTAVDATITGIDPAVAPAPPVA